MDAHKNLAISSVATAPSPAASGTSLVVTTGEGARFPAVPFNATVWPANERPTPANAEIVRVTSRSTDTLTIARTQEGTSARTIVVGDLIAATITVKALDDIEASLLAAESNHPAHLPWHYDFPGIAQPDLNTGFTTIYAAQMLYGGVRLSSGAQNDEVAWDLVLAAGTWSVTLITQNQASVGIFTVSFDGSSIGTVDSYAASPTYDNVATITGAVVAATGKVRVKFKMASKNGSSGGYYGVLQGFHLRRTA